MFTPIEAHFFSESIVGLSEVYILELLRSEEPHRKSGFTLVPAAVDSARPSLTSPPAGFP